MDQFIGKWTAEKPSNEVPGYADFVRALELPAEVTDRTKGRKANVEISQDGDTWIIKTGMEGLPSRITQFKQGQEVETESFNGNVISIKQNTAHCLRVYSKRCLAISIWLYTILCGAGIGQEFAIECLDKGVKYSFQGNKWIEESKSIANPNRKSTLTERTVDGNVMNVKVAITGTGTAISFRLMRQ